MGLSSRSKGLWLVIIGATCWGIGGTVAKKLFAQFAIDVNWLVSTRLLVAGILLLALQYVLSGRSAVFSVWTHKATAGRLILFGLVGMLTVQYTYMASIQHGNAAVATLLQYLSPVMIIVYLLLRRQMALTSRDGVMVFLALLGCFLLLTNGSLASLTVPAPAIIWGILSGVAAAFYTLYAASLVRQYDSLTIVGWAMVIGGCGLSLIHPPWQTDFAHMPSVIWLYMAFIIVFGTMIAFWFYVKSLQYLPAREVSLLGSLEPLAAVLTTVFWLHTPFGWFQWLGTACIIGLILLLTLNRQSTAA